MIHFEERKIKYTTFFCLYLRELRLIKNTRLDSNNSNVLTFASNVSYSYQKLHLDASLFVYQRELLNLFIMLG